MNWEDFKAKYGDRPKDIIFAIAFLEGKEMGIREMAERKDAECQERVKEICKKVDDMINTYMFGDGSFITFQDKWQALKKQEGIE